MKVYFSTRVRSFFKHLFSSQYVSATFLYSDDKFYDTSSILRSILVKIVRSKFCDLLGIIQIIKCKDKNCDINGSYNRFLDSDKPYFVYVENPTALFHYSLERNKTFLGKKKITKQLNNPNLKGIVFMSKACANTFETVCGKINSKCLSEVIYPLVPSNKNISFDIIYERTQRPGLRLLYIAQGIRFTSKGALEIIEAIKILRNSGYDIQIRMITSVCDVNADLLKSIISLEGVSVEDFKYSYSELEKIYAEADILLQPTSDDSCSLTIFEALQAGLPILATQLYAIPELVKDGLNGFLTEPHYWYFTPDNKPNPFIWNNMNNTIYSNKISEKIVSFLVAKLKLLYEDKKLLEKLSINSYKIAHSFPFDEKSISAQWDDFLLRILR